MTSRLSSSPASATTKTYTWIALFYDALASVYSGGGINAAKCAAVKKFLLRRKDAPPDENQLEELLVVGAGTCQEVGEFPATGVKLTLLDSSQAMLNRVQRNCIQAHCDSSGVTDGKHIDLVQQNFFEYKPHVLFTGVFVPFFLNVFSVTQQKQVCQQITGWAKSDGEIWVADFAPARSPSNVVSQFFQLLYYYLPLGFFWLFSTNAWNSLPDYDSHFDHLGWALVESHPIRIFGMGPAWFQASCYRRVSS